MSTSRRMLVGHVDVYNGVTIDEACLPDDTETFDVLLEESLDQWKQIGRRGLWLTVPVRKIALVSVAVAKGFTLHHADSEGVTLTKWLPKDEVNKMPHYASHVVGVGGLVLNSRDEILLIKERVTAYAPLWKLPGGMVEEGEDISSAAMREVLEETGIHTEFIKLLCFRECHKRRWGKTDLYFVACLAPLSEEIHIDPNEISCCQWMPLKEYAEHPDVHPLNREVARIALHGVREEVGLGMRKYPHSTVFVPPNHNTASLM